LPKEIYRKLARGLDAIPPGLPPTESGVELRLLAKHYTPEEAALASVMRQAPEPADDIAARAGVDPHTALHTLEEMAAQGLIAAKESKGQPIFGLSPFLGGVFEEQVHRLDKESATLFEQYYQETQGPGARETPAWHRVIPVAEAIPFGIEISPYEQATEILTSAKSWGVRPCLCRLQQQLVGKGCGRPIGNCVVFAPTEGAFDDSKVDRPVTLEEALQLLRQAQELGLVHTLPNYRDGLDYICNCCTCCCFVLRGVAEFDVPTAVAHSDFRVVVDAELCEGCADCVERCQFGALSAPEDLSVVDYMRCVGCGSCVTVCPTDALHLERRAEGEVSLPPTDADEWMVQRAAARDTSGGVAIVHGGVRKCRLLGRD